MSNTWHKTRWFHVGCRETEQSSPVDAVSMTTSARWLTAVQDVRARGAWRALSSYLCTRSRFVLWLSPTPMSWPRVHLHCQSHQRLPSDQSTSRCAHLRLSAVSPTLKAAVAQPTTVPLNPVMPTPEPHCYQWGPEVSRQWRVRDLPGVPLCLYSFFLLEALGLVLRLSFWYGGFFFDLKTQCWLEF